ncbi:CD1E protein, partial [Dromaius novaehollandiae]|nr:CD1E protein [Dromaius novaehollandiae]
GPLTVRMLQTSSFFGFSSSDVEVLGLLADVEVTTLDWSSHKIHFLRPWVFPALAPTEWADLELLLNSYLGNLAHMVDQIVRQRTMTFPVVVQCSMGCREDAGSGFYDTAYDGQDFVSFTARNGSWTRRRDDELARYVEAVLNHDEGTCATMVHLFNITCIKALHRLAQHGKEDLERQVKPVAVVFAKVPNPARLLLVCRVTGFYPRPVSVAWLRDGQEVPPGPELSATPPLPNADLTYQLRSVLAVAPHDGHRYACRVQHSSLGGRSLLVPWG